MEMIRLAGPPGVGKSTLGELLARRRAEEGTVTGFVDIDQLGMLYPAPEGDEDRWALKERALRAVAAVHRRLGTGLLVVSGVADPDAAPPSCPGAELRSLWLLASPGTLHSRLAVRGWDGEQVEETVATGSAESARRHPDWASLPLDDLDEDEALGQVHSALAAQHPTTVPDDHHDTAGSSAPARVTWVTGPRCAGSSSVGFSLAAGEWARGVRCGFLDLAQLSFRRGGEGTDGIDTALGLEVLATVAGVLQDAGGDELVVVAPLEVTPQQAAAALPGSALRFLRLVDVPAALAARVRERVRGGGPILAGDDLRGADEEHVRAVIARAAEQAALPLREGEELLPVEGRSAAQLAELVRAAPAPSAVSGG